MPKSIIKKQTEEKLKALSEVLQKLDLNSALANELNDLQRLMEEAQRLLAVCEYLRSEQDLAPDINMHMKVMEESAKKISEQVIINTPPPAEEKKEVTPPQPELKVVTDSTEKNKPLRKMEMGINDKFRIINELFAQNQHEFNIAVEQLNAVNSWKEAETYLLGLSGLYNWDEEKDVVKTLWRLAQKRFQ